MKKIIIAFFILFELLSLQAIAATYGYKGPRPSQGGYGRVFVACYQFVCQLECKNYGSGTLECTWDEGFNDCRGCLLVDMFLFENARGEEMFNHALDQIDEGNHAGSYTNNIINSPSGTYYRTVEWEFDPLTEEYDITIDINEP